MKIDYAILADKAADLVLFGQVEVWLVKGNHLTNSEHLAQSTTPAKGKEASKAYLDYYIFSLENRVPAFAQTKV